MKKINVLITILLFVSGIALAQKDPCKGWTSEDNNQKTNTTIAKLIKDAFENSKGLLAIKGTYYRHILYAKWEVNKDATGEPTEKYQLVNIIYKDKNGDCRHAIMPVRRQYEGGGKYGAMYTEANSLASGGDGIKPPKIDCACADNLPDWLGSNNSTGSTSSSNTDSKTTKSSNKSAIPDGPYELKDASGELKQSGTYKDGKKQGTWKSYSKGNLYLEENYLDDEKDGMETQYNKDGTVEYKMEFKAGKQNGKTQFFEGGKLKSDNTYLAGKKNGKCTTYYSSGSKYSEENYVNGKLEGEKTSYDNTGKPTEIQTYKENRLNGPCKKYSGGKLTEEGNYLNGMQDGVWKKYDPKTGKIIETKTYKEGVPQ